ncbi:MAG: hypothetical protein V4707_03965 [Pseudomonadota bacterium]
MIRLITVASFGVLGLAACTQPAETTKTETKVVEVPSTRTVVETREVAAPTVVVREVQAPPVVIERDRRGDSTTVRAGENGVEIETTRNR